MASSYRFFQSISALVTAMFGLFFARVFFAASPLFDKPWAGESLVVLICLPLGFWIIPILFFKVQKWVEDTISQTVAHVAQGFWRRGYFSSSKSEDEVLLDTSAIIDGRIFKVAGSGFIPGPLVLPFPVLLELQQLADSADELKRQRGKRGLRLLEDFKKYGFLITLPDNKFNLKRKGSVDKFILQLAIYRRARLATIDSNLAKMAGVSGVGVLNVNQLALSLRSDFLPGELVKVSLVQTGKNENQGVGYLEDGTMVVVSGGSGLIGSQVQVKVQRFVQTEAGLMVFGKLAS